MKSEKRGQSSVPGTAMKRGGFAQHDLEEKIVEGESTCMRSKVMAQDPSAGKAILISCVSIAVKLFSLEPSSAVRALDVRRPITGLCTLLEGEGGSLAFGGSDNFIVDLKFTLSACRGEVCIYMSPILAISRINNFVFHACCIEYALTYERTHMQTYTQSDSVECLLVIQLIGTMIISADMHSLVITRSCAHVCTSVHSIVCLCMQASTIHARDSNRFAAQVAKE